MSLAPPPPPPPTTTNHSTTSTTTANATTASEEPSHIRQLISIHQRLPKYYHHAPPSLPPSAVIPRRPHGGIFPVTEDPITRQIYVLFGLDRRGRYNDFHGLVDDSETIDQGSAREGWEESKAVIGDLPTLWRAVTLKGQFSTLVGHPGKNMHMVNLGPMNSLERSALCSRFMQAPGWSRCSREIKGVKFFELKTLRFLCMEELRRQEEKRKGITMADKNQVALPPQQQQNTADDDSYGEDSDVDDDYDNEDDEQQQQRKPNPPATTTKSTSKNDAAIAKALRSSTRSQQHYHVVVNINEQTGAQEVLRDGMATGMCDRRFWSNEMIVELLEMAQPLSKIVLPLSELPKLTKEEELKLPFNKKTSSSFATTTTATNRHHQNTSSSQPQRSGSNRGGAGRRR